MSERLSIDGEGENWSVSQRFTSGRPLIVRSRASEPALREFAKSNVMMILKGVLPSGQVREDGMPQSTQELNDFEDALLKALNDAAARTYLLAVLTGNGQRAFIFAGADREELRSVIRDLPIEPSFKLMISDIDDKEQFLESLASPLAKQLAGDQQVLRTLQQHGDDPSMARPVRFYFYGKRAGVDRLAEGLTAEGFTVDTSFNNPDGVRLLRTMTVRAEDFEALTPKILAAADAEGVEYDGWETSIEKSETAQRSGLLGRLFGGN